MHPHQSFLQEKQMSLILIFKTIIFLFDDQEHPHWQLKTKKQKIQAIKQREYQWDQTQFKKSILKTHRVKYRIWQLHQYKSVNSQVASTNEWFKNRKIVPTLSFQKNLNLLSVPNCSDSCCVKYLTIWWCCSNLRSNIVSTALTSKSSQGVWWFTSHKSYNRNVRR